LPSALPPSLRPPPGAATLTGMTHALPLLLALACASGPANDPPDAAVSDAGELQGEWEVVSCRIGSTDETTLFEGDRWAFSGPSRVRIDAKRGPAARIAVRANPAADPPTINRGIYRRTGDELLWADDLVGDGRRPSSANRKPRGGRGNWWTCSAPGAGRPPPEDSSTPAGLATGRPRMPKPP
jgi:hypothetical protein